MSFPETLKFISAQPDEVYFHWQVELYIYNFIKKGIPKENIYAIFAIKTRPSIFIKNLKKKYPHIYWYMDTRKSNKYQPSIRPHILKKFFLEFPDIGEHVFYHDSDILFYNLPNFKKYLNNDIYYLSDTHNYIGYNYFEKICKGYKNSHPELDDMDLLHKMADSVNIDFDLIKKNDINSGGAQYLLKNIDINFWEKVEEDSNKLYTVMCDYEKKYPTSKHVQKWCADMWGVLWNCWKNNKETRIVIDLSFSWATNSINTPQSYKKHNIFHLAGISKEFIEMNPDYFYKGKYNKTNFLEVLREDIHSFDYVNENNNSWMYVKCAIDYICKEKNIEYGTKTKSIIIRKPENKYNILPVKEAYEFQFKVPKLSNISGIYKKTDKKYFNKNLWFCKEKDTIIFYNKFKWVITDKKYECEISEKCGGYLWSEITDKSPHQCKWDIN